MPGSDNSTVRQKIMPQHSINEYFGPLCRFRICECHGVPCLQLKRNVANEKKMGCAICCAEFRNNNGKMHLSSYMKKTPNNAVLQPRRAGICYNGRSKLDNSLIRTGFFPQHTRCGGEPAHMRIQCERARIKVLRLGSIKHPAAVGEIIRRQRGATVDPSGRVRPVQLDHRVISGCCKVTG